MEASAEMRIQPESFSHQDSKWFAIFFIGTSNRPPERTEVKIHLGENMSVPQHGRPLLSAQCLKSPDITAVLRGTGSFEGKSWLEAFVQMNWYF